MSATARNTRTICTAVLVCVVSRSTWSFPLLQPAVIMFPTQNFMQQPFQNSVVLPLRMGAINQLRNTHYASQSPESTFNNEQPKHNGPWDMNPHNIYENNNMNPPNVYENNINTHKQAETDSQHDDENSMHQQNIYENNNMNPQNIYENNNMNPQNIYQNNNKNPQNIYENNINQAATKQDYDSIVIELGNQPFSGYIPPIGEFPDGRFAIGGIITGIPWLPFEVNVPDTIAWMYNGITGIIGGIGQRIPFINSFTSPNEPRPYSAMNQMYPGSPLMMPLRLLQIPMPMMNMQRPVLRK